jgi:hypothetical protein
MARSRVEPARSRQGTPNDEPDMASCREACDGSRGNSDQTGTDYSTSLMSVTTNMIHFDKHPKGCGISGIEGGANAPFATPMFRQIGCIRAGAAQGGALDYGAPSSAPASFSA